MAEHNGSPTSHTLQLAPIPFLAIASGHKVIESRLYDERRQLMNIGDTIEFVNRESSDQKVIGLLRYETFRDLFSYNNPIKFGGKSIQHLEDQIKVFYSIEDQRRNGVIGIEFELASIPQS